VITTIVRERTVQTPAFTITTQLFFAIQTLLTLKETRADVK